MDFLRIIVDKALEYPRKGTHVGSGPHVAMPVTWDGLGPTPLGWAKSASVPWVATAADAVLPLPEDLTVELQSAPAQARLTTAERAQLSAAIAARGATILDGRSPKANAVAAKAAAEEEGKP